MIPSYFHQPTDCARFVEFLCRDHASSCLCNCASTLFTWCEISRENRLHLFVEAHTFDHSSRLVRMSSPDPVALQLNQITDVYQYATCIFLLTVGLVSNIALILMFTMMKAFRGNQCAFYLTVVCFADLGLLLIYCPPTIASYIKQFIIGRVYLAWCKISLASSYGFGLCSFYTICFIAFDQYLATNHRVHWRQLSSINLAYRLTFFIITLALCHCVLFVVFGDVGNVGCSVYHPILKLYFTFFFYPILGGSLPVLISISFSFLAFNNVRRIVRRQVTVVRRRLDRQMTALALTRVLCVIILGLPFLGSSLYELNFTSVDPTRVAVMRLVSAITYSILFVNYSVSYAIRLADRFRWISSRSISIFSYLSHHVFVTKRNNFSPRKFGVSARAGVTTSWSTAHTIALDLRSFLKTSLILSLTELRLNIFTCFDNHSNKIPKIDSGCIEREWLVETRF